MVTEAELDALRQTYEVSFRQMQTFLDAQARMIDVAQDRALEAREELERVAEALSPGMVDEKRKASPVGTSQMTSRELADAVIAHVKQYVSRMEIDVVSRQDQSRERERVLAENARLRDHAARLERELADKERLLRQEQTHSATLQKALDAQRQGGASTPAAEEADQPSAPARTEPPVGPSGETAEGLLPSQLPEWIQTWRAERGYEQGLALLGVLAETGLARREEAVRMLERAGIDASVTPVFSRCERLGLIELVATGTDEKDTLVYLTDLGRQACQLLLDLEPVPSPAAELLARHDDAAQVMAILEAAGLLREAGYTVDLLPDPVALDDGRTFVPNLAASLHGRTLLVEVAGGRDHQWSDYHEAAGGEFYVVVPDKRTLEAVKGSILFWAGTWQRLTLRMCNIEEVRGGGRQDNEIWTLKREQ